MYDTLHLLGKIVRIPGLVEDRFPKPYARTVSVSSYNVSDIIAVFQEAAQTYQEISVTVL